MHAWVFEKSTRRFWTGFGGVGGLTPVVSRHLEPKDLLRNSFAKSASSSETLFT